MENPTFLIVSLLVSFGCCVFIWVMERKSSKRNQKMLKELHRLDGQMIQYIFEAGMKVKRCRWCDSPPEKIVGWPKKIIPVCSYHFTLVNENKSIQ